MSRPRHSLEYAAQLEARARDIRAQANRQARADATRVNVLLGALVLADARAHPSDAAAVLRRLGGLSSLRDKDLGFLLERLPPALADALHEGRATRGATQ